MLPTKGDSWFDACGYDTSVNWTGWLYKPFRVCFIRKRYFMLLFLEKNQPEGIPSITYTAKIAQYVTKFLSILNIIVFNWLHDWFRPKNPRIKNTLTIIITNSSYHLSYLMYITFSLQNLRFIINVKITIIVFHRILLIRIYSE